ncbi:MAG: putative quinol monooxygenase [Acidimicrobiales bacterium]
MTDKIAIIAKLSAAEGKADELRSALESLIAAAHSESGLEVYFAGTNAKDDTDLYFFEIYADDEAFAVHGKGEDMKDAMRGLGGLLAGAPEIIKLDPVVAKGLDL